MTPKLPLQASAPPVVVVAPRDVPITAPDVDSDPIAAVTQGYRWSSLRHPEHLAAFIAPALDRGAPVTVDAIRSALLELVNSFPEPKRRTLELALNRAKASFKRWLECGTSSERAAYYERRIAALQERFDSELADPLMPLRVAISDAVRLLETSPAFADYVVSEARAWIAAHD